MFKKWLLEIWELISNFLRVVGVGALGTAVMVPSIVDADLIAKFALASLSASVVVLLLRISLLRKKATSNNAA